MGHETSTGVCILLQLGQLKLTLSHDSDSWKIPHLKHLRILLIKGLTFNLTFHMAMNSGKRLDKNSIFIEDEFLNFFFLKFIIVYYTLAFQYVLSLS